MSIQKTHFSIFFAVTTQQFANVKTKEETTQNPPQIQYHLLVFTGFGRFDHCGLVFRLHNSLSLSSDSVQTGVVPVLPKSLCKRVVINFQLGNPKVLIRRHSHKFSLWKSKSHAFMSHNYRLVSCGHASIWNRYYVKPRNVAMHGV